MSVATTNARLTAPGVHTASYRGAETPASFGDTAAEFRALLTGAGVFDMSWQAKLKLNGKDRTRWANGMVSNNIDDTRVRTRPVHTRLLAANVPICEHMTNLGSLPDSGFRFSAVPPKVRGMGTFPIRPYALIA